ncbi:hypothetical protein [Thalassomonas actiniarum]|uniref:Uncharacterized protein n=1 Tax=Thalassomonas actiniarum TaxID=485447 RepID=A0AAF0C3R9_9GAMM|nr:hypothetical protein [Thalassomonas actiniarum]WDD99263.1 hypothetical protein SG35_000810 [Thalassomonas actiniarum]
MKIICHLGNPKAYSTSIQTMLAESEQGQFHYIGFRPSKDKANWYDNPLISELLNFDLRYTGKFHFQQKCPDYQAYFNKLTAQAKAQNKDIWLSSENLSMRAIMEEIDPQEKIARLQKVLPDGITFVVIFRNIWASLRSLYSEFTKMGYCKSFDYFTDETYLYRQANFLYSLFPGHLITSLQQELTGSNQLRYHFLDNDPKLSSTKLHAFLSSLQPGAELEPLKNINSSQEKSGTSESRRLSNAQSHSALSSTGLIENHRALWHLKKEQQQIFDQHIWGKLRQQKKNNQKAEHVAAKENLRCSARLTDFINRLYPEDKALLAGNLNTDYQQLWQNVFPDTGS